MAPYPRRNTLGSGTKITLNLKEDAEEYANSVCICNMSKHNSEFVTHYIHLRTSNITEVDIPDDNDVNLEVEDGEEIRRAKTTIWRYHMRVLTGYLMAAAAAKSEVSEATVGSCTKEHPKANHPPFGSVGNQMKLFDNLADNNLVNRGDDGVKPGRVQMGG